MDILITNGRIYTCNNQKDELTKGHILIRNGIIEDITENATQHYANVDRIIDAHGKIIIPGLINAHTHSYANITKGSTGTMPLEMWMVYIMALGKLLEPEDVYYSVLLGIAEMLKTGTTACIDHLAQSYEGLEAAMAAYEISGMRTAMAPMISDKDYLDSLPPVAEDIPTGLFNTVHPPSGQELMETTSRLFKKWHRKNGRLNVLTGPSGPQRCSDALLKRCASFARDYDTVLHTHLLETRKQVETGMTFYGKPMVLHLEEIGMLNCKTSFAHCVWLTEPEVETAANRNSVIVHNPASNLRLGSGKAPIGAYKKAGLTIALGTDGTNCGCSVNMFESMRLAGILHNPDEPLPEQWIRPDEVLSMATLNGAKAAGLDHETGSLEVGKKADITVLNPKRSFALNPLEQPLNQIIYGESGNAVETVIIEGKIVVDDGVITTFDEKMVFDEVGKRVERLQARYLKTKGKVEAEAAFIRRAAL